MDQVKIITVETNTLDFNEVVNLEKDFMTVLRSAPSAILIDFKNVEFVDSRAIGLLVGLYMQSVRKEIAFGVFNLTDDVRYIFKVTAVDTEINVYENEKEALEKIQKE
jgi:anti-anti-sigma factor